MWMDEAWWVLPGDLVDGLKAVTLWNWLLLKLEVEVGRIHQTLK